MTQANLQFSRASDVRITDRLRLSTRTMTLAGTLTLIATDAPVQFLDPGGAARNVDLPALSEGLVFVIANTADAAEIITVRDAAAATVCTPTQDETAFVFCNGVTWRGLVGASS